MRSRSGYGTSPPGSDRPVLGPHAAARSADGRRRTAVRHRPAARRLGLGAAARVASRNRPLLPPAGVAPTLARHHRPARGVAHPCARALAMAHPRLVPIGLFSAHMLQHEALMVVAAPLFVIGRPLGAWAWALPLAWRRAIGRFFHRPGWRRPWLVITGPLAAWLIHALALWLWHIPAWFRSACSRPTCCSTKR